MHGPGKLLRVPEKFALLSGHRGERASWAHSNAPDLPRLPRSFAQVAACLPACYTIAIASPSIARVHVDRLIKWRTAYVNEMYAR